MGSADVPNLTSVQVHGPEQTVQSEAVHVHTCQIVSSTCNHAAAAFMEVVAINTNRSTLRCFDAYFWKKSCHFLST